MSEVQMFSHSPFSKIENNTNLKGLLPLLQRLDLIIQPAISTVLEPEEELTPASFEQIAVANKDIPPLQLNDDSPLAWLQKTFELSAFDLDILAIAIAPELDPQYSLIYGNLQNDITQTRPTVDLALNLLCSTIEEKLAHRQCFTTASSLIAQNLLYLSAKEQPATLLEHFLILDRQVVRFLLQQPGLDSRLTGCSQLIPPSQTHTLYLKPNIEQELTALVEENWQQPLLLYFSGCDRISKRQMAENLADSLQVSLLVVDLSRLIQDKDNEDKLRLALREAWFFYRLLYMDNFDLLYLPENRTFARTCFQVIEEHKNITILAGVEPYKPSETTAPSIIDVPFPIPETNQRRKCWQTHLQQAQISLEDWKLDLLSDRFWLTPDRIASAVTTAQNKAGWEFLTTESQSNSDPFLNLCNAARAQSSLDLGRIASKIEPKYTWDDIILQSDRLRQLRDICQEWEYRDLVHRQWGFADKLSLGKGLNVLFAGVSGTGKTMAAEVIANQLQLDLYKIDLSQIISKYIGETEKNLNLIFTAATNSNAILLFDEADALFGKRSEVQDARDRYANIEVGYLLQKMEEYSGIAILTTNLRDNIDKAFERRLRFIIKFSLPDAQNRYLLWQKVFPQNAPCGALNLEFLAQNFELSGASIRNIALSAAFLAAGDRKTIEMTHIVKAIQREYQKNGRVLRNKDFGQYANEL